MQIGVQLYTLRDVDDSVSERIERVAATAFEGVQFAGLGGETPEAIASTLERTGLDVAGAHVGLDAFENEYENTIDAYDTLECNGLIVPYYESDAFETESGSREAGRRLSRIADRVIEDGKSLHYHNHHAEFTDFGEKIAFDIFADAAQGVGLEIDTGLANYGGVDPVALLEQYGDRVEFVHLTDSNVESDDNRHMDLGNGTVDLQGCVDAAADADVDWLLFEHGLTDDPVASVSHAADVMTDLVS